ncbi:hypothetical protein EDS67_27120, partial [candidate division KSB1 bacterium]
KSALPWALAQTKARMADWKVRPPLGAGANQSTHCRTGRSALPWALAQTKARIVGLEGPPSLALH